MHDELNYACTLVRVGARVQASSSRKCLHMKDQVQGRAGGLARAQTVSAERRAEISSRAAIARWGAKATHRGNFKEQLGVDVECYVLNDRTKTAVISQRGMARALGFSPGGSSLPRFLATRAMADSVGADLREKIENPVEFQWSTAGVGNSLPYKVYGFDATLLIDICNAISAAEISGALKADRYKRIVQNARIIVGACAKNGIRDLVYRLSGYNPTTEEVIAAFKLYISEEARKYEPEFPNELYEQWHRLYRIPVPLRGKPWHFKYLTVRHIYFPLAKSSGKVLILLRALKTKDGNRQRKLFQFLNDVGTRALRMHLGRVVEMAESSATEQEYEQKIVQRFGGQQELDLIVPGAPIAPVAPIVLSPPS